MIEEYGKILKQQIEASRKNAMNLPDDHKKLILGELDNIEKSVAEADFDKIMKTIGKLNDTGTN